MKKIFVIFVAILMLIMSACGKSEEAGNSADTVPSKTLKVLTSAVTNPLEYKENGQIVGFDIDLINALAKEAGYTVQIEDVGWDAMFLKIQNKNADLAISGITITDDRKQTYDFSFPLLVARNSILVPEDSDINSAEDLKDKMVAVQPGSTGYAAIEKLLGKDSSNLLNITGNTIYMEVFQGSADAAIGDNMNQHSFLKFNPNLKGKIVVDDKVFAPEYLGIMYPKGSPLKADFDKAINTLLDNGTYASIYKKWFKSEPDIIEKLKAQQ